MEYRKLGNTGLVVSEIAYGSWLTFASQVDLSRAKDIIRTAFDLGINHIDTADVYAKGAAEELLGNLLPGGYRRQDYVIASKVFWPMGEGVNDKGLSRKHIFDSINGSLQRLKLEYLDIYYCHRYDPETPLSETVEAMKDVIRMGKSLYWGVSEWTADQITEAYTICRERGWPLPVVDQPSYSILNRSIERRIMQVCTEKGIGLAVFSPLAQGILTGKYSGGKIPEGSRASIEGLNMFMRDRVSDRELLDRVDMLAPIAKRYGISMGQLAIAFILSRPAVSSVIVGASNGTQLRENAAASGVKLDSETVKEIEELFPFSAA